MLEEKVYIHPHDGVAEIQVLLCNNENTRRDEYLGFIIEHVEIRPIALRAESQGKHFGVTFLNLLQFIGPVH